MTIQLGVIMDPIQSIKYHKDTTLAMLLAASRRNWELWYMEQGDLALDNGVATARMRPLRVFADPDKFYQLGEPQIRPLKTLNTVLMRKDPPFNSEYIYSSYILEAAERDGVLIVNKPQSLRDCNEKVFATLFPQCTPPLLVSSDEQQLKGFHREHGDTIYKPLDGMGGSAIFRVTGDDPNLSVIIETLTDYGQQTIMAQRFIPEISAGDKRILMVDGEAIPHCLARIPGEGELRGNLAAGGSGVVQPLSERDHWIAAQVGPELKKRGLLFVGLDVIGDYITEINVTSPTCIQEIDRDSGSDIAGQLMDVIEQRL
ncbi:MAG: glutathione synthase [Porticoccaceae bacterium]|nr:glutathione synthase [Porticoccaceae bacterium]